MQNKQTLTKAPPRKNSCKKVYSLGDLVRVLDGCTKDTAEMIAALADLFETGRVRACDHGQLKKLKLAAC